MDTLGSPGTAGLVPTNGHETPSIVGHSADAPPDDFEESALDLLRPRFLIRLLDRQQMVELIAAAISSATNPLHAATQQRIYRDFAAEMADEQPEADLTDNSLRVAWLVRQLEEVHDEHIIGAALGAWSYSMLEWPDDPYTSVHHVVSFLREHEDGDDEDGVAAAIVLVEKAMRKWLAVAANPDQAALHLVIRSVDTNTAFSLVIEAARVAGFPIDGVVARLRDVCRSQGNADESQDGGAATPGDRHSATSTVLPGQSEALADAIAAFDVSAHMASARTMSVLDQVLVRQAIASAVGMDGALTVKQLYALIDEVIRLNPNRHQTYHARGFVDAVCGEEISMQFRLANDERRVWVLCGALIGTLRNNDNDAVARLITEHAGVFEMLLAKPELYAGAWLLEPLYPLLRDQGRFDALSRLFQTNLERLSRAAQKRVIARVMNDSRDLILAGKAERAVDLLDAIGPGLMPANELAIAAAEQSRFLQLAMWRRGQAALARGDFGKARGFLDELLQHRDLSPAFEAKVMADVGLAKAQLRRIHEVFPRDDKATSDSVVASLANGMEEFFKAVELDSNAAVRSRLCLAVLASESRSTPDAIDHLRRFLQASMNEKPGYYGEYAQAWTRFLLALAIMEAGDGADYPNAADELRDALRVPGFVPPAYVCARLADAFAQAGFNESADSLLAVVEQKDALALPQIVVERRLEGCSARGRDCLLAYAQRPGLPIDERLTLLSRVLQAATQNNDGNVLTHLAAAVQDLGEVDLANCAQYIELAEACREQVTEESLIEAFEETQVALWKASGRYEPVFARLSRVVDDLLDSGGAYDLEYAAEILDDLEALPAAWIRDRVAPLRTRLSSATTPAGKQSLVDVLARRSSPVRIYVVGGGDRHRGYEATITQRLPERFPSGKVEVEFLFPGFSANWMPHVETVRRNIARFDAVVLIYATRTKFGEWVRDLAREAVVPAYTCGRQGRGAVIHAIAKAVEKAISRQGVD